MKTTLKDILNFVFRYFKHLALFTVVVVLIAAGYGAGAKRMYKSEAKLLVRLGSEQSASTQYIGNMSNVFVTRREQEMKNELEILTSDWVMTEVARQIVTADDQRFQPSYYPWRFISTVVDWVKDRLGFKTDTDETLAEVKSYIADNLSVAALFESDTLELSFTFPDPEVAQAILRMVIEQYIKHHIQAYANVKELDFLSNELEASRRNYELLLDRLTKFTQEHGVFNDAHQLGLLMEKKRDLERELAEFRADYEYHSRKLVRLQDLKGPVEPYETFNTTEILNQTHENLKNKLNEAQIEKQILMTRYTEDSRFVNDIDREISQLKKLMNSEPRRVVNQKDSRKNPVYETLVSDIMSLESEVVGEKGKIDSLEIELEKIRAELAVFSETNKEFQLLTKEVDFAKRTYEKVFEGHLDTKLKNLIGLQEITNISVIGQPSLNRTADSPDKKKLAVLTLTVLVAGTLFLLVFFSVIDTAVTNPSEIPNLVGSTVAGAVPFVKPARDGGQAFLWLYRKHIRPFQNLYTQLALKDEQDQVILVAKSRYGEGGTTISYNLAVFMAAFQGKKVALVDFDGHSPIIKDLKAEERVDSNFEKSDILYISVYKFTPDSDEDAKKIKDNYYILKDLKKDYDFIVVNLPPVSDSPDLVFLQRYVNKVILVIEAEKTSAPIVKYNLSLLEEYAFKNVSALLNKRKYHIPEFLYRFL